MNENKNVANLTANDVSDNTANENPNLTDNNLNSSATQSSADTESVNPNLSDDGLNSSAKQGDDINLSDMAADKTVDGAPKRKEKKHPFYNMLRAAVGLFFPKNEVVWETERPDENEPVIYVCNHGKIYPAVFFLLQKKKVRPWANHFFIYYNECRTHMREKVCYGKRKILRPLAFILTPLIVNVFRAIDPIPVYKKSVRVQETFKESVQALIDNQSQVIFPERTENRVNKYIFEFQVGFPMVAELYYLETGKRLKFYPVYCAQPLRKVMIGKPIEYNPDIPIKLQRVEICKYLQDKIGELGDSLPEHTPPYYG